MTGLHRHFHRENGVILLLLGIFSIVWLLPMLPDLDSPIFWVGGEFSDLLISHLPNSLYLKRMMATTGQVPLWNSSILSGIPFAADPLSGLHYPPIWVTQFVNPIIAFNVLFVAHLFWLGVGGWVLSKEEGLSGIAGLSVGILLSGHPKLIGHIGLGHVSLVYAVSWTPWLLIAVGRAFRYQEPTRSKTKWVAFSGAMAGFIFLIDPRWLLPSGIIAAGYGLWLSRHVVRTQWAKLIGFSLIGTTMALLIASVLILPLLEWVRLSTRSLITVEEVGAYSVGPAEFVRSLLPQFGANPETLLFVSIAAVFLVIVAVIYRGGEVIFWLIVAAAAMLLSFGENIPIFSLVIENLPGASLIRVPGRWLFIVNFGMAMLAGYGVDAILQASKKASRERKLKMIVFTAAGLIVMLNIGIAFLTDIPIRRILLWIAFVLSSAGAVVYWASRGGKFDRVVVFGLIAILSVELIIANSAMIESRPTDPREASVRSLLALASEREGEGLLRIYSPSYSIPQHIGAELGIEQADGVHPLQLAAYVEQMGTWTGFESETYSVTLPPFPSGAPDVPWGAELDLEGLGELNVAYIMVSYPLSGKGLTLIERIDSLYLYENSSRRPRAWIEPENGVEEIEIDVVDWTPNHIIFQANGPGTFVISEIDYPGWNARVDNETREIETYQNTLRSIQLGAGEHEIQLSFEPRSLQWGLVGTLLGLIVLVGVIRWV